MLKIDIEEPVPNKTETKRSEPNWNIFFSFWIFYFHIVTFNF